MLRSSLSLSLRSHLSDAVNPPPLLLSFAARFARRYRFLARFLAVQSSCAQYLNAISVPFLVVNANDDPFFDKGCYVRDEDVNTGLMRAIYTEVRS